MNTKNGHHDQELDRRFRRGLREHTIAPATDAWSRVRTGQKKRRPFLFWLLPLLLVALVGSTGVYWFITEPESRIKAQPASERNILLTEKTTSPKLKVVPDTLTKKVNAPNAVKVIDENATKRTSNVAPQTPEKQTTPAKKQVTATKRQTVKQAVIHPDSNLVTTLPSPQLLDSIPRVVEPAVTESEPDIVNQIRLVISRGSSAGSREEEQAQEQKPQKNNLLKRLWKLKKEGIRVNEIIQSPKNK